MDFLPATDVVIHDIYVLLSVPTWAIVLGVCGIMALVAVPIAMLVMRRKK